MDNDNISEIREFSKIWQYIKSKKCDMRILEDKKIKLVSFDYYNEILLNILKEQGEITICRLTALFMMEYHISANSRRGRQLHEGGALRLFFKLLWHLYLRCRYINRSLRFNGISRTKKLIG